MNLHYRLLLALMCYLVIASLTVVALVVARGNVA